MGNLAEASRCEESLGRLAGTGVRRLDVESRHQPYLPARRRELDVDAVVLAIGPGDSKEHQCPPEGAEPTLLRQGLVELELRAFHHVVVALALLDAVDPDAKGGTGSTRQLHQ